MDIHYRKWLSASAASQLALRNALEGAPEAFILAAHARLLSWEACKPRALSKLSAGVTESLALRLAQSVLLLVRQDCQAAGTCPQLAGMVERLDLRLLRPDVLLARPDCWPAMPECRLTRPECRLARPERWLARPAAGRASPEAPGAAGARLLRSVRSACATAPASTSTNISDASPAPSAPKGSSSLMLPKGFSSEAVGLSAWLAGLCCAPEASGDEGSSSATEGSACAQNCQRLCLGL